MKKKLFLLAFILSLLASTAYSATYYFYRYREHATDCTSLTDGKAYDVCWEVDDEEFYKCEPATGDCDTAGEWKNTPNFDNHDLADIGDTNISGAAEGDVLYRDSGGDWVNLAAGTGGYALITQGSGNPPVWGDVSNMVIYTSDDTFTVPSGVTKIMVWGCAGGGGGGEEGSNAGGGGGGGESIAGALFDVTPSANISITIGQGGAGGTGDSGDHGDDGTDTVIGSLVTLEKGTGGNDENDGGSGGDNLGVGGATGGSGGSVYGIDGGDGGGNGFTSNPGGGGGGTLFGAGGDGGDSAAGDDGTGYGSGGGGGGGSNNDGGDGQDGIVIIMY